MNLWEDMTIIKILSNQSNRYNSFYYIVDHWKGSKNFHFCYIYHPTNKWWFTMIKIYRKKYSIHNSKSVSVLRKNIFISRLVITITSLHKKSFILIYLQHLYLRDFLSLSIIYFNTDYRIYFQKLLRTSRRHMSQLPRKRFLSKRREFLFNEVVVHIVCCYGSDSNCPKALIRSD